MPSKRRSTTSRGRIRVGTSGWTYDGWRGPFYPETLAKRRWLQHYATCFPTVEINGSFYRTPSVDAVRTWHDETPDDFSFAWKASKFITHWKRLGPTCPSSLALMQTRLRPMAPKIAAVLFQLPPSLKKDCERLRAFLHMLPHGHRYAFEFRHKSWYQDDAFELLHKHKVAFCISDHADAPAPWEVTTDLVYVRGHGPGGQYRGSYPKRTLERWADTIKKWARQRRDVLVYFDNDQKAAAPGDAERLIALLGGPRRRNKRDPRR